MIYIHRMYFQYSIGSTSCSSSVISAGSPTMYTELAHGPPQTKASSPLQGMKQASVGMGSWSAVKYVSPQKHSWENWSPMYLYLLYVCVCFIGEVGKSGGRGGGRASRRRGGSGERV